MSYGAQILNSSGQVVFDTNNPCYVVDSKHSLTVGPAAQIKYWYRYNFGDPSVLSTEGSNAYPIPNPIKDLWVYDVAPFDEQASLLFFEIGVGEYAFMNYSNGSHQMFYSQPSVNMVKVVPASIAVTPPPAMGMATYNELSERTWSSNLTLANLAGVIGATHPAADWFSWSGESYFWNYLTYSTLHASAYPGFFRETSTTITEYMCHRLANTSNIWLPNGINLPNVTGFVANMNLAAF